ncbi:MAG: hypothetical protein ACXV3F_14125 [Frankiaceae bacterium]
MTGLALLGGESDHVLRMLDLGAQPESGYLPPVAYSEDSRWPRGLWLSRICGVLQIAPVEPLPPGIRMAVASATCRASARSFVA